MTYGPHVRAPTDRQLDRGEGLLTDGDCHAQIETFQVTLEKV